MISCLLSQTTKLLKGLRNLKGLNLLGEELILRLSFKISPIDKATKKMGRHVCEPMHFKY